MTHIVFIALGSNLGDRQANLQAAILAMAPEVVPIDCSPVYETPPWGYLDQPRFLNQVIKAETDLSPADLLKHLMAIEVRLGREETIRFGPRLIDLDILFYDDEIIDSHPLRIPHPRMESRGFVLLPLADLAADMQHPVSGISVRELLARVDQKGIAMISPGGCTKE
jgi:2-amino-4-hydroxy-6-hydroxymethyldihydropteridine diphosphokinase